MPDLIRTLIWQRRVPSGAEYFGLWRDGEGWQLRGTVIVPLDDVPYRIRYGVICDSAWHTRAVHVAVRAGSEERALHLTSDGKGNWERSGEPLLDLRGCIDIDLEITPATNTLPIRRLNLNVGDRVPVTAAWLRFPDLTLEPLDQTYARVAEDRFRYDSGPDFTADLEVDDLGLVSRYADLWECVAVHDVGVPQISD